MDLNKIYKELKNDLNENNSKITLAKGAIQENTQKLNEYEKIDYFIKGEMKMLLRMSDLLKKYFEETDTDIKQDNNQNK